MHISAAYHVAYERELGINILLEASGGEIEVERRLTVDAISRAKIRIKEGSFDDGQIYAMEINDLWEDQAGSVNLGRVEQQGGGEMRE